jgi:hypothetical protein
MVHDSLRSGLLDDVAFAKLSPCSITSGAITAIPGLTMRCVAGSARRCARSTIWRSSDAFPVVVAALGRMGGTEQARVVIENRSAATSSLRGR